MNRTIGLAVLCLSVCFVIGCSKKEEPAPTPAPSATQPGGGMMGQAAQMAKDTTEAVKETAAEAVEQVKQAFTMDVDLNKTVDVLKAEAGEMDLESLKQVAAKYKDAIVSKQDQIKTLTQKLADVPMTQKLGQEAQKLTADIKTLTDTLAGLKDRLNVYLEAITAKGGDVSGLKP